MTEMYVAGAMIRFGLARLLGVVRRHLEADPRPERTEERDAGRSSRPRMAVLSVCPELGRVERVHRDAVVAALEEHGEAEDQQADELGDEEDAEDLGRQLDVEEREQRP